MLQSVFSQSPKFRKQKQLGRRVAVSHVPQVRGIVFPLEPIEILISNCKWFTSSRHHTSEGRDQTGWSFWCSSTSHKDRRCMQEPMSLCLASFCTGSCRLDMVQSPTLTGDEQNSYCHMTILRTRWAGEKQLGVWCGNCVWSSRRSSGQRHWQPSKCQVDSRIEGWDFWRWDFPRVQDMWGCFYPLLYIKPYTW